MFFFFFKQKTAYEMRISDWSSDVCSSDLRVKIASLRLQSLAPDMHGPRPNGAEAVPLTYLKAGSFAGFSLSTLHQGEKAFFWWSWPVVACGSGAGEVPPARDQIGRASGRARVEEEVEDREVGGEVKK